MQRLFEFLKVTVILNLCVTSPTLSISLDVLPTTESYRRRIPKLI